MVSIFNTVIKFPLYLEMHTHIKKIVTYFQFEKKSL